MITDEVETESKTAEVDAEAKTQDNASQPEGSEAESESLKLDRRNRKLAAELSETRKRLAELEEAKAKESGDVTSILKQREKRIAELEDNLGTIQSEIQRRDQELLTQKFAERVTSGVAEQHRQVVREVLQARILGGTYPLDNDTDIASLSKRARKELSDTYPHLFDAPSGPPASQAPASADSWKGAKTLMDVPRELWGQIPADEFKRLTSMGGGRSGTI